LLEDDEHLVMVMELVKGQTLQSILDEVGVFSPRRAADLCMQALAALAHAHAAGVVHRDLKPGNLMITESGSIKIMDFGIARLDGAINLTNVGQMLGTPAYMAPEQVLGHPVDPRADVYAMGVVFFRLVTAALPFNCENPFDMAQAQVKDAPAKATSVRPDLPAWVDEVIARAMAKSPAQRFQSAMEFHGAFARAIADVTPPRPTVVPPLERTEIMERPDFLRTSAAAEQPSDPKAPQRSTAAWMMLAGAAVIVAAGGWVLTRGLEPAVDAPSATPVAVSPLDEDQPLKPITVSRVDESSALAPAGPTDPAKADAAASRSKPTPVPAAGSAPSKPILPDASFTNVKLLTVSGSRTTASDVALHFQDAAVSVQSSDAKAAATALRYPEIAKATYVHARDPQWDPLLSAPSGKIDVPGILGRARHWLVVQGRDAYVILRLDGADRLDVLKAFEDRTGVAVERPPVR
jgi:serine/threonine protein kinase